MERLLDRPTWSLSGSEKLSALDTLQADLNRLQTLRLELLAALDADAYATELGARSTADLIAIRHRLDPTEVRRDLRLAQALRRYPLVDTALQTTPNPDAHSTHADSTHADPMGAESAGTDSAGAEPVAESTPAGDAGPNPAGGTGPADARAGGAAIGVHLGQAAVIVGELEKVRALRRVSPEDRRVAEEVLVEAAGVLSPGDLRVLGRQVRERLDTDGPEPDDEERVYAREKLWLKRQGGGVQFGGYLAGENAELLQTLTFAGAKPHKTADGDPDPRTRAQRQADALSGVLAAAASTGTAAPGHGGIKPHITVTIDWAALQAAVGAGTATGAGAGAGVLAHGGRLSAAVVRRLACDAGIIPLVLGSNSEPLDVGMEERFVTPAIRLALNARDRGCIVCHAPAAMCDAHHVIHWIDGGPTAINNLVLACKAHHREIHHGHWTITFTNGHPALSRPTWATPTPARNQSGAPATQSGTTGRSATSTIRPSEQPQGAHEADHPNASPPGPADVTDSPGSRRPEPNELNDARAWAADSGAEVGGPGARSSDSGVGAGGLGVWGPEPGAGAGRPDARRSEGGGLDDARAWAAECGAEAGGPGARSSESGAGAGGLGVWGSESGAGAGSPGARGSEPGAGDLGVEGSDFSGWVARPLGGTAHPLGDSLSRWLRQGKADYPDPWADTPQPAEITPRADSPPTAAAAD